MSSERQYFTNVFAQGIGRALSMCSNLLAAIAVARLFGAEIFGQFAYVMAFLAIATSIADMNTTSVLAQGLSRAKNTHGATYLGNFLILRGGTTAFATLLALICALFIKPDLVALLLICSLAIPLITTRFYEPLFQIYDRPWYSTNVNIIYSIAHLSVIVTILYWARMPLAAYLIGLILCHLAYTLAAVFLSLNLVRPKIRLDRGLLRSMWVIAGPLGIGSLFYMINSKADIFMLGYMRSDYEVGVYNAAYKFLEMEIFVALTVLTPVIPILTLKISERSDSAMKICAGLMEAAAACVLPIAVTTPFLAVTLVELVFGSGYSASAGILHVFAWTAVLAVLSLVCMVINIAEGKVKHAYWNTALATVINVALNFVLIPRYGIQGAAYATVASYLSLLLVNFFYVTKNVGNIIQPQRWVQIAVINLGLLLALVLGRVETGVVGIVAMLAVYVLIAGLTRLLPIPHFILQAIMRR